MLLQVLVEPEIAAEPCSFYSNRGVNAEEVALMSLYFLTTALFYLCGFSSPCLQPSAAILMGDLLRFFFFSFFLKLPSASLEEGTTAAWDPELFALLSQRRRERKMNPSIYAATLMMVGKGKYVNKEPLFASAVTRQRLGERLLPLLSFPPIIIDFLCCIEAALASHARM